MRKRRHHKEVCMLYIFDRLANKKLSQAYNFLVPEKNFSYVVGSDVGDTRYEGNSHLRTSLFGQAERRTNHR